MLSMTKNCLKNLMLTLLISSLLGGCIGSKARVKNADLDESFPSLHTVPNRPKNALPAQHKSLKDALTDTATETAIAINADPSALTASQQDNKIQKADAETNTETEKHLDKNRDLRRQFGL